jgi:hypothetical protein
VAKAPRIPERSEYRQLLAQLDRPARGRVMRAANLARPAADPYEAALAAATAAAQRRFWRRWWLAGPVVATLLQVRQTLDVVLANLFMATVMFGGMAAFFVWWSGRAERVNRMVVEEAAAEAATKQQRKAKGAKRKRKSKSKKKGKR